MASTVRENFIDAIKVKQKLAQLSAIADESLCSAHVACMTCTSGSEIKKYKFRAKWAMDARVGPV